MPYRVAFDPLERARELPAAVGLEGRGIRCLRPSPEGSSRGGHRQALINHPAASAHTLVDGSSVRAVTSWRPNHAFNAMDSRNAPVCGSTKATRVPV